MKKKVFGMTLDDIATMQNEILGWVDTNHPYVDTPEGHDGFRVAFVEGAAELRADPTSRKVFAKVFGNQDTGKA